MHNCVHSFSGLHVNHLKSVIGDGSHEKTLAFHVHTKVIDASFDICQRNPRIERQRLWLLPNGAGAQNEKHCEQQHGDDVPRLLSLAHRLWRLLPQDHLPWFTVYLLSHDFQIIEVRHGVGFSPQTFLSEQANTA
jgi:hypothetical protein